MTLSATALFLNRDQQVGDPTVVQVVGKGLTATFDSFAATAESINATTAWLSNAQAVAQ